MLHGYPWRPPWSRPTESEHPSAPSRAHIRRMFRTQPLPEAAKAPLLSGTKSRASRVQHYLVIVQPRVKRHKRALILCVPVLIRCACSGVSHICHLADELVTMRTKAKMSPLNDGGRKKNELGWGAGLNRGGLRLLGSLTALCLMSSLMQNSGCSFFLRLRLTQAPNSDNCVTSAAYRTTFDTLLSLLIGI